MCIVNFLKHIDIFGKKLYNVCTLIGGEFMKYCSKCGTEMREDDIFCPECGAKTTADAPRESVIGVISPSMTPRQRMLRGVVGSQWTHTMAVSSTVYFILSLISSLLSVSMLTNALQSIIDYYSYEFYYYDYSWIGSLINSVVSSSSMLTYAFIALHVIGWWSIYKWSRKTDKVSPVGFTFLKAVYIYDIVKICPIALVLLALTVIMIIAATLTAEYEAILLASVLSVILLFASAFFILAIIYYAKWIKTLNGATEICRNGTTAKKPSTFLVVINCLLIGITALSFVVSLTFVAVPSNLLANLYLQAFYDNLSYYGMVDDLYALFNAVFPPFYIKIVSLLASGANLLYLICETVFLSHYNNGLKNTK